MTELNIIDKKDTETNDLSGGYKRRLSLAIALMGNSKSTLIPRIITFLVLFLDEPTSALDPVSKRLTWDVLKKRKMNSVVVLTTHSMVWVWTEEGEEEEKEASGPNLEMQDFTIFFRKKLTYSETKLRLCTEVGVKQKGLFHKENFNAEDLHYF